MRLLFKIAALFTIGQVSLGDVTSPRDDQIIHFVEVGIGQHFKLGHWTPVRVVLQAGTNLVEGQLTITVPDGDGIHCEFANTKLVAVASGQRQELETYVRIGRPDGEFTIRINQDGQEKAVLKTRISQLAQPVLASQQWVVSVGSSVGIDQLMIGQRVPASERPVLVVLDSAHALPRRSIGYGAIDALVIATSNHGTIQGVAGVQKWVALGGRIILLMGQGGEQVFSQPGPIQKLVPGAFDRVAIQRETGATEAFAGSREPLDQHVADGQRRFGMPVTVLKDIRGVVECAEGAGATYRPIVIRAPHGLGQVVWVACDLDQSPFSQWQGRRRMMGRILELAGIKPDSEQTQQRGSVSHIGFQDLVGQLRSALDQFPDVRLVPFWIVATLAVLYVAWIGPLDYFALRRFAAHMHRTWITFPMIAIAVCALAFGIAHQTKGMRYQCNQLDLVDIDMLTGAVRGNSWLHLFSPQSQRVDLTSQPTFLRKSKDMSTLLAWQGLPGSNFGAMNVQQGLGASHDPYRVAISCVDGDKGLKASIQGFPLENWSSRSLVNRWWATIAFRGRSDLAIDQNGLLNGSFQNPFDVRMTEAILFYKRWAYQVDKIDAKQEVRVDTLGPPRNVQWLLTGRRFVEQGELTQPWDSRSFDVPRILRAMMFHEASGGREYTHLLNRYQNELDLSGHLQFDRAILFAQIDDPSVKISSNDERVTSSGQNWSFCRLIVPVGNE